MHVPPVFTYEEFRKSSFSGEDGLECVMIAQRDGHAAVLDSKGGPLSPQLRFTQGALKSFMSATTSS